MITECSSLDRCSDLANRFDAIYYVRCYRRFTDSSLSKWVQLYIPESSVLNNIGDAFEISGNSIVLKKTGVYFLSAVVAVNLSAAGSVGIKYTYRVPSDDGSDASLNIGVPVSRQTHWAQAGSEALTASGIFYGLAGDRITIESYHSTAINDGSSIDIRIGLVK